MPLLNENNLINGTVGDLYRDLYNTSLGQVSDYIGPHSAIWDTPRMVLGAITIVLAVLFVIVVVKINRLIGVKINLAKEILPPQPATSGLNARWDEVLKHINSTREAEWKFGVIEADKLVDELLKGAGFPGDTMGDRLMNIQPGQLTTLQGLWEAHKIRNRLVHDANYFLRYTEAKRAVGLYEKTLKELQAI